MDRQKIAAELLKLAKELVSAETFPCPDCGTKVLENTGYCLKCKKKVKQAAVAAGTFPCPNCGTKVLENTKYCLKCKKKVEPK
jgi:DNA-directed RNA polymerase subunit RPC12/RpoP